MWFVTGGMICCSPRLVCVGIICCGVDSYLPVFISGHRLSNSLVLEMIECLLFCASKVTETIIAITFQECEYFSFIFLREIICFLFCFYTEFSDIIYRSSSL